MSTIESAASADYWTNQAQNALARYSEPLLRRVMQQLLKPRNQWPVEELIERGLSTLTNAAVIDRRLNDLPISSQKLLAVIGLSRQPVWRIGHLIAILATLDHVEGLTPIQTLLNEGLVHPMLPEGIKTLRQFEDWLGPEGIATAKLFAHPAITNRALGVDLGLPSLPTEKIQSNSSRHTDGLEWLLRTAVAWSRVAADPLRLTQQQSLFKRDLQRFQTDELLNSPFAEHLTDLPDVGCLALALAVAANLIDVEGDEFRIRPAPGLWTKKLLFSLSDLWRSLLAVETWDPLKGYILTEDGGLFASVIFPACLILRSLKADEWIQAESIAGHLFQRHPSWSAALNKKASDATEWLEKFFLGVAHPLRFLDAVQEKNGWWFRLGDLGRHLLKNDKPPDFEHEFKQTLVVQPNGEMIVFRQGLNPELIGILSRLALWKTLGLACTMELTAESVYRGLETGLTLADMQRVLEQHGSRAIPATILDALQRWSSKRERITVWASATLLEFSSTEDLDAAFARGLVTAKLNERIGIAAGGEEIDYRHFRLVGNRDYESRPLQCVAFDRDGVTFTVDAAQSDLLLEAELVRIAVPLPAQENGPRRFMLTPESLRQAQQRGFSLMELEQWALERSGAPLSNAARLLCSGSTFPATCRRRLVVQLPSELVTDGIVQWPKTSVLVEERLGPTAIAVASSDLQNLIDALRNVGVEIQTIEGD